MWMENERKCKGQHPFGRESVTYMMRSRAHNEGNRITTLRAAASWDWVTFLPRARGLGSRTRRSYRR